ncbi:methyltransferase domain-containing protein [Aestuariispira ectoiniformans]|uniref:methyltransferase domain-containing protein n=1 Tax=Aestuariispira ectoiniformans TaxID=2775080 RepID=UPI00223A9663|nr:methyltransferase domain-containing protein [Aestuariispira ectoiniformans]
MTDAIHVFDRKLLAQRKERAHRMGGDSDFLFREVADRLADRLLDVTRAFPLALDLGGHAGVVAQELQGRGGVETLIQANLSHGGARLAGAHGPSLVCDEEWLPLKEGIFDLVISNLSLHWTNDLPGALIQVCRALRPDGLFQGAILGGETLRELRDCLMQAELDISGGVSPRVSPFADVRDLGGLMQRAGFSLPVVDSEAITVTYENMFRLIADLRGMGETNAVLERSKAIPPRQLFMRAAELYQQNYSNEDGRIEATFHIFYLHGWAPDASQPKPLRPGSATGSLAEALGGQEFAAGEKVNIPTPKDGDEGDK